MALRGRARIASDDFDRASDSSPDPLAMSLSETTTKSPRKKTPRNALAASSPSKRNRRSSVSEFDASSPSKAMVLNTPRMGSASPWRIKVTVHAEPGSDENEHSPSVKRITRTQTTTVPLKDEVAPAPIKKGRGRPRKSDVGATPKPKPKRPGTPVKRRARSKSQAESSAADVDTDAPPKKKMGRPRKSVHPSGENEDTMMILKTLGTNDVETGASPKKKMGRPRKSVQPPDENEDTMMIAADVDTDAPPKKKMGRPRKSIQPLDENENTMMIAAVVDTDAPPKKKMGRPRKSVQPSYENEDTMMILKSLGTNDVAPKEALAPSSTPKTSTSHTSTRFTTPQVSDPMTEATDATPQSSHQMDRMADYEMPLADTPPQTELGQRLRARKGTPHAKKVVQVTPSEGESDMGSGMLTPTTGDEAIERVEAPSNVPTAAQHERPEADELVLITLSSDEPVADEEEDLQDVTKFAFDEGTTRMPDDTTVIDSENFSMISVDSLPSSGGLTSPAQPEDATSAAPATHSIAEHIFLKPSTKPGAGAQRPIPRRYVTPGVDAANPPAPPVIEPAQTLLPKAETPQLGRVVTAGVALQGLLDPSRLTPEPSRKVLDEKRNRLDDLFRGFSEGTRKELQAGLRLGEQLAQDQPEDQHSPARTSPAKPQTEKFVEAEWQPISHQKAGQSRLLTPEDQDEPAARSPAQYEPENVQYPSLDAATTEKSLPSPVQSEPDEMSWRFDTPPPAATGATERMRFMVIAGQVDEGDDADTHTTAGASSPAKQEEYSDIWQEEASRSSNAAEGEEIPQVQDLFEPGPSVPARGKLPRTWRRASGNHFQYSDEAESPQQESPQHSGADHVTPEDIPEDDAPEEVEEDGDVASDDSDDTGMFFQSNMPNIFSNRHSRDLKQKKAAKLDLTLLLNEGESMAPESSPPVAVKRSSPAPKSNPFLNTPPRFKGFPRSPSKSSPLRQELRGSDISSESHSRIQDESSLPLPQSSPFHTFVEGESKTSVASDQRQLFMEMEGVTDSSIRLVRKEADQYLEAYEPQDRTLGEIEEVTEHSRTWQKNTSIVASSPPSPMKLLSPVRKRVPLFQDSAEKPKYTSHKARESPDNKVFDANKATHQQPDAANTPQQRTEQQSTGILSRMTSNFWSAVTQPAVTQPAVTQPAAPQPAAQPNTAPSPSKMPQHPCMRNLMPLPAIEPWTKTHYRTLDRMFNWHQKSPDMFNPTPERPTKFSRINAHLLKKFLANNGKPYLGAVFNAWGYQFEMNGSCIVLCQVFLDLLTLPSIESWEQLNEKEIEMGDCAPRTAGRVIDGAEVARRFASVKLGAEVRADEKRGVAIERDGPMKVYWPSKERQRGIKGEFDRQLRRLRG